MLYFGVVSCSGVTPPDHLTQRRAEHSHPHQLIRDFQQMIEAVQSGQAEASSELLKSYMVSEEEFKTLFGKPVSDTAWPTYKAEVLEPALAESGPAMNERIKAGLTQVEVKRVSSIRPRATTAGDILMLDTLKVPVEMYTVRLRKDDEQLGFRINGFFYADGRWRCLMKAYNHLPNDERRP